MSLRQAGIGKHSKVAIPVSEQNDHRMTSMRSLKGKF